MAATANSNPLDHTSLATRVQTKFNAAYRDVVLDEYCADCDDCCSNNLIVQFEDDPIDQGSWLARTLLAAYDAAGDGQKNSTTSTNAASEDDDDRRRDETPATYGVKFARLSGGHLTPVMLRGDIASMIPRRAITLLSSTMGKSSNQKQQRNVEDVADTVASYIRSLKAR